MKKNLHIIHISTIGIALIIITLGLFSFQLNAQKVSGVVLEKGTNKPIAFASILAQGTTHRTNTDVNGHFELKLHHFPAGLRITSMGYSDTLIHVDSNIVLRVVLTQIKKKRQKALTNNASAVAVVKKAIFFREKNDPEANYPFTFKSYTKMVFGNGADSSTTSKKAADNRYRYISESVTKRKFFPPDFNYERVVGNRFSGLTNPDITMIANLYQPFSFYKNYVKILGIQYLSPVARKSYKNYNFELVDSYYENRDTLYVIQFQPKPGKTFNGLKGIMTINSNRYAIQNIRITSSNPYSKGKIELEQTSAFIDSLQWFPVHYSTYLTIHKKHYGEDLDVSNIEARGSTYITDIKIAAKVYKEDFYDLGIELTDNANTHTQKYWKTNRVEPLTEKELNTYKYVDSIGVIKNYDQKLAIGEGLPRGELPIGPVSFELDRLIDYNDFEGIRLGLGVRTSNKVSKLFSVGAYGAYGFADKAFKYGGDLKFDISRRKNISVGVKYKKDVITSGGNSFYKPGVFKLRTYSKIYTARMDYQEGFEGYFAFRFLRDFQNKLFYSSYNQSYNYDYSYKIGSGDTLLKTGDTFKNVEVGLSIRFGFRENHLNLLKQSVSLGTRFPYLWFRVAYSSPSIGSSFRYTKVDLKIEKSYRIKGLGKIGFMLMAGQTFGDAPASLLHYGRGMRSGDVGLYIENAFNTMQPNEFLSDKYASLHFNLNFGAIYKSKFSAPQLSLVAASGWGSLTNPEFHQEIKFKTMEKFFNEAGLLLDNIFVYKSAGVGAGVFYRIGEYAFDDASANIATRISVFYRFD